MCSLILQSLPPHTHSCFLKPKAPVPKRHRFCQVAWPPFRAELVRKVKGSRRATGPEVESTERGGLTLEPTPLTIQPGVSGCRGWGRSMHSKANEECAGVKRSDRAQRLVRDGHTKENTCVSQKQQREGRSDSENGLCFSSPFKGKSRLCVFAFKNMHVCV